MSNRTYTLLLLAGLIVAALANQHAQPNMRLIQFSETETKWMPVEEVEKLSSECTGHRKGFMDITDHPDLKPSDLKVKPDPLPKKLTHHAEVQKYINQIVKEEAKATNDMLTAFYNRYYTSQTGKDAALALQQKFKSYIGDRNDVTVELFNHKWLQPSVIARIQGHNDTLKDQVVIISAHEDSINGRNHAGRAPGADDDGSGCSTVMEAFRVLVTGGFKPARTVEFHLYAGEELGLLGSQDVAAFYQKNNVNVYAQMQLDMTFYTRTPGVMGLITDYVDSELTQFVGLLAQEYTGLTVKASRCGYACSDHASWTRAGYRSSFPFETTFGQDNPYIHTENDVWAHLDLDHGVNFIQLAIGFVVELSQ